MLKRNNTHICDKFSLILYDSFDNKNIRDIKLRHMKLLNQIVN